MKRKISGQKVVLIATTTFNGTGKNWHGSMEIGRAYLPSTCSIFATPRALRSGVASMQDLLGAQAFTVVRGEVGAD